MTDRKPDDRSGAELRRHERAAVTLLVEYDGAEDFVGDYTDNLSTGGTFVVTSRTLEVGTVVRLVLVPATMELLGDRNWWMPAWLDRILPNVNVEGPALHREPSGAPAGAD